MINHLGNVLLTVTDRRLQVADETEMDKRHHYQADVVTAQDYYPFGMMMPERSYQASGTSDYRYGFNGKENDNEVKGEGNQQDYGMRVYDPRLGKFLSVDPLTKDYPFYSPYQFAGNKPIWAVDLDGAEEYIVTRELYSHGTTRRIRIWYTKLKEAPRQNVNYQFARVMKTDPQTKQHILGEPLTDRLIARTTISSTGQRLTTFSNTLTPLETGVLTSKSKNETSNDENDYWETRANGNSYDSKATGDAATQQDMVATARFNLIQPNELNQTYSADFLYLGTTPVVGGSDQAGNPAMNGQVEWQSASGIRILRLRDRIQEDGQIRSISINIRMACGDISQAQYDEYKRGIDAAAERIRIVLQTSGVPRNRITVQTTLDRNGNLANMGTTINLSRQ